MKKIFLIPAVLLIFNLIFAQEQSTNLVKWIDFKTAQKLDSLVHKPFLIDVYTDWCGWCNVMSKNTYSNKALADYINTNFYAVKLNSEKDDSIFFKGKLYVIKNRLNELAVLLLNGRMSYPTTVFIALNGQPFPIPGYLEVNELEPFLVYFAEDLNNYTGLNEFDIDYMFTYPQHYKASISKLADSLKPDTSGVAKWYTFKEAQGLAKQVKHKYIVFASIPWCNGCKVMKKITFSNSVVSKLVNDNFYLIDFDATTTDTIEVNGVKYKSLGTGQPNEFALQLFTNKYSFPSVFFFDEDFKLITQIPNYADSKFMEVVLNYVKSNSYKKIGFDDYLKTFKSSIK